MKKKIVYISVLVGILLVAQLLASAVAAEKVTINYLERMSSEDWGKEIYERIPMEYQKVNPDVKINMISVASANERQQILLRGQAGTIDMCEPKVSEIAQFAEAGILEPIRNYCTDEELAGYLKGTLIDGTYNGVEYGIPYMLGPIILYVNKDLIQRAGYGVRGPEDILEFKDMIAKITALGTNAKGQDIHGFALRSKRTPNTALWFMGWLWQWGGQLVDRFDTPVFNSIGAKKAVEFYYWMGTNGHSVPAASANDTRIAFAQGTAGFVYDGPWLSGMLRTISGNPDIDEMYITAPMPKAWDGTRWSIANTTHQAVISTSKHKKEAFDFIKWYTSNETIYEDLFKVMGFITPMEKMLAENPLFQQPLAKTSMAQLPYANGTPWKSANWPAAMNILSTALSSAVLGEDVDTLVEEAQSELVKLVEAE